MAEEITERILVCRDPYKQQSWNGWLQVTGYRLWTDGQTDVRTYRCIDREMCRLKYYFTGAALPGGPGGPRPTKFSENH